MIAARVELLQGPVAQRPLSQLSMGVTREVLDPVTKIWTRGEGLRHGAAEAMPARVVRQPEEMEGIDCAEVRARKAEIVIDLNHIAR